jgi:hypothetical protein
MRGDFDLRISALEDDTPTKVVVTDVKKNSFKVCWITEKETLGGVRLLDGSEILEDDITSYHEVVIASLNPGTNYTFEVLSDSKAYKDETGVDYQVKTALIGNTDETFLVYGQVFSSEGYSFQQGGIITMQLIDGSTKSQIVSTAINETGGYQLDIGGLLSESFTVPVSYKKKVDAVFNVYVSHTEPGIEKRYSVEFLNNRQIPNMYLGEVNIDVIPAIQGN